MARRRGHIVHAWMYEVDGDRLGPVSNTDMLGLIAAGTVEPSTRVWRQGLAEWIPVSESQLAVHFGDSGTPAPETIATAEDIAAQASVRSALQAPGDVRRLEGRWVFFKYTLIAYLAFTIALCIGTVATFRFWAISDAGQFESEEQMLQLATIIDSINGLFGLGSLIMYVMSIVLYCLFFHRAMRNLHQMHFAGAEMSPGWTWGWHFVPFANLWKPIDGAMQVWRGSMTLAGTANKIPAIMGLWWASWLIGSVLANVGFRMKLEAGLFGSGITDLELFRTAMKFDFVSSVLVIFSTIFLLMVCGRIAKAQRSFDLASQVDVFS